MNILRFILAIVCLMISNHYMPDAVKHILWGTAWFIVGGFLIPTSWSERVWNWMIDEKQN